MKLSQLKLNKANPRFIRDEKFKKLLSSVKDFPKMMELRPIVYDTDGTILGGNMRYRALVELGFKEIPNGWAVSADSLTDEEKKRFIIEDNVGFGEFDMDMLANGWDSEELTDWGVDLPVYPDFSGKNGEIDTDQFSEKMEMKFQFSSDEFSFVMNALSIDESKEKSLLSILNYEPQV